MQIIRFIGNIKIPKSKRIKYLTGGLYLLSGKLQMMCVRHLKPDKNALNSEPREKKIIVSLTSFPGRIQTVHYTIITLMRQTIKPDKIILWLAQDEFEGVALPKQLERLTEYGLEIRFCENLRSHKKYYFAMVENPEDVIITADDDIIYPENQLESLIRKYVEFPNCVVTYQSQKMMFDENYNPVEYNKMKYVSSFGLDKPEMLLLPVGCGCVLYPPGALNKEVFNKEAIKETAFLTDDLWLKAMAILNKTKAVVATGRVRTLNVVEETQKFSLAQINVGKNNNDISLRKIVAKYPELIEIIKSDKE